MGERNLTLSSDFFQNLLTDPYKALAPEIKAQQDQITQNDLQNANFGNRSGGTNASTQAAKAEGRANLLSTAAGAQTSAAGELASTGGNLLNTGISGHEAGFGEAQQIQAQKAQQMNDLIKDIVGTAGGVVAGLPGAPGGAQDEWSNLLGAVA